MKSILSLFILLVSTKLLAAQSASDTVDDLSDNRLGIFAKAVSSKQSNRALDKLCQNEGYYLVKDTLKDGLLERTLFLRVDPTNTNKKRTELKPTLMGPKSNYSVKEAMAIMKFQDEEELIHMTSNNDGWKCISINHIGDFNSDAKKYFDSKNPKPPKQQTFNDTLMGTLRKWNKKLEGQK